MLEQPIRPRKFLLATPFPAVLKDSTAHELLLLMLGLLMPAALILLLESLAAAIEGTCEGSFICMSS